ncbi:hypothetical protein [Micromonospora sp. NBC_01796]|uniref:hypothetical protein n=1 Tax=Micromonospora sp. NBC_01796 TaxID=2975987 RepID=UPI002DDBBE8B|nr:hypothetical protein [Micromonospora sp. NBC_01796]WSA89456.1 hypothetical protein OIE47_18635 [Micromonospora sp. NBC_01796]
MMLQVGDVLDLQPSDYRRESEGRDDKRPLRMRVTHIPDRLGLVVAQWVALVGVEVLYEGDGEKLELAVHRRALPDGHPHLRLAEPHFVSPLPGRGEL